MATTRWWPKTTLPQVFGVTDATEDDLYEAMDWVLERQERIEQKLAARHLEAGGLALYDLTSSYFEGTACPLARFGHNRDGKKGKLQVNYGLLTNGQGIPVSVSVFEGNTSDPKTLLSAVGRVREKFGIAWFTIVGDRGMITQVQIDVLREIEGLDWITALRSEGIAKLLQDGAIQMGLFDECNLFELTHPDFPGERLVACRNPQLAQRRAHKRQELLEATRTGTGEGAPDGLTEPVGGSRGDPAPGGEDSETLQGGPVLHARRPRRRFRLRNRFGRDGGRFGRYRRHRSRQPPA